MKATSFLLTLITLAIVIFTIKILDNIEFAFGIPFLCCALGFVMLKQKTNIPLKNIGTGIFYGSLFVLIVFGIFFIWLIYNFPK